MSRRIDPTDLHDEASDEDLSADERAALEAGLEASWAELEAGEAISADFALRRIAAIR